MPVRALAGLAAVAVARTSAAGAQPLTPVKIGAVVLGDFGVVTPTLVGIEKGYFKKNGLDAELIPFKGGPDLLKGVLSGSADIGSPGRRTRSSSASAERRSGRWRR